MFYVCKICNQSFVSHLDNRDICFSCKDSESIWRNKIAEEVEQAWSKFVLRGYYSSDLAAKMIVKYIRSGDDETLR
jgi:hypothetical protein